MTRTCSGAKTSATGHNPFPENYRCAAIKFLSLRRYKISRHCTAFTTSHCQHVNVDLKLQALRELRTSHQSRVAMEFSRALCAALFSFALTLHCDCFANDMEVCYFIATNTLRKVLFCILLVQSNVLTHMAKQQNSEILIREPWLKFLFLPSTPVYLYRFFAVTALSNK